MRIAMLPLFAVLLTASVCGVRKPPQLPTLVPTPVPCVTGDVPDEPRHVEGELTHDSGVDIGIIAGSAIELRAWGRALKMIVEACRVTPATQPTHSGL